MYEICKNSRKINYMIKLTKDMRKVLKAFKKGIKIKAIGETKNYWILSIKGKKVYFPKTKIK